jgi:uncharacterized protein YjbI with pentapeptide repeats
MINFKFFNNFNKKIFFLLIALLIFASLFVLARDIDKQLAKAPFIRAQIINIAKIAIPIKNLILMRNIDDKIASFKSSGSCIFCNLSQGNFKENDLKGIDLRYASLVGVNFSNINLQGTILRLANLSRANLNGVDLTNKDLTGVNLSAADLTNIDLTGTILKDANLSGVNLSGVDLTNKDLTGVNLSETDLRNKDLTGTSLRYTNLSGANLNGVDLTNKDLTGVNLSEVDLKNIDLTGANLTGVDLTNKDLTGTSLRYTNLSGANLNGVDLTNKDLTGVNLSEVDLKNIDLTGASLKDAIKKIEIRVKNPSNSNWPAINEIKNLKVTRYELSGDVQYLSTKEGLLFQHKNSESKLVLDLNNDALFPFYSDYFEMGFLGIASQKELVYISYTSQDDNGLNSLVVDEYSKNFTKVRNILKIDGYLGGFGGNLLFDNLGRLYLTSGDGGSGQAQDLNSLKGKILRLDISELNLEPEIIVYGVRNPWGVTIDLKNRMFVTSCGASKAEAVWVLNDLYSNTPVNLGWPVFEGSIRNREDPLKLSDISTPIFETTSRPGCLTAGIYLEDHQSLLFGDYFGAVRVLKQRENGEWYLRHEIKTDVITAGIMSDDNFINTIWGFGFDKKTKKIFIAPDSKEIEILVDQVKFNQ